MAAPSTGPAADPAAAYDYTSDDVATDDVAAVMAYCADEEIPVLPRGGGTSLAGQSVNRAVVLDFSRYMDDIVDVDPDAETATAQAGTVLGDLNTECRPHGLKFAPDPAWGDKSVLGGAIGNNSTGAHSLQYGKTDYYIEEVEAVLADGTVTRFGEMQVVQGSVDCSSASGVDCISWSLIRSRTHETAASASVFINARAPPRSSITTTPAVASASDSAITNP